MIITPQKTIPSDFKLILELMRGVRKARQKGWKTKSRIIHERDVIEIANPPFNPSSSCLSTTVDGVTTVNLLAPRGKKGMNAFIAGLEALKKRLPEGRRVSFISNGRHWVLVISNSPQSIFAWTIKHTVPSYSTPIGIAISLYGNEMRAGEVVALNDELKSTTTWIREGAVLRVFPK